jgi:hypothetical protein
MACQVVQTRKIGDDTCDKTFSPAKEDVCVGVSFTQKNSCGDTKNVTGEKEDCDNTCEDTS